MTGKSYIVETKYGTLRGEDAGGVSVWRGIPYASPPVGDLRFRKPEPPASWEGVRDALAFGPICPQSGSFRRRGRASVTEMSEDCLTLNIWSPAADGAKRPVLFYIHGGSFSDGAGSDKEYDGTGITRDGDIVLVTINYRLGALGFMDFSFLDDSFVPNCGFWDILAALRWVNENIEAFGGDPDNVTVCGQSAGGISVCILATMDEACGYLKRGIMMSGLPTLLHTREQAQKVARGFLEFMGISDADGLRAACDLDLAARQKEFALNHALGAATFAPCADGDLVVRYPIPAAKEGETCGVPMLIGTTREEMSIVFKKTLSRLVDISVLRKKGVQAELEEAKKRISAAYERYGRRGPAIMVSDYVFRMPSVWFAEAHSKSTCTWMYRFDYETFGMRMSGLHAFHSSDIPFLFGNFKVGLARYMLAFSPVKTGIRKVHKELRGDFLTFIKTGELPWEKCDGENTPAKCYALPSFFEQAVHPEVKDAYNGSEFKRRSLAGESNNLAD
ncbi:MAG: carboxylesterase/lipase family protein [Clostridiales bacterium]|nr:carboxylesterase/lipase family protein [Clostridiales bacterium]